MAPMTAYERDRARAWLKECRGALSQAVLADDISRVMKWRITRDRYSKYESGGADFGPNVLRKFVDYWALQGKPGPDLSAPVATPVPDLATALMALAEELRLAREARDKTEVRLRALEGALGILSLREAGLHAKRSVPPSKAGSGPR